MSLTIVDDEIEEDDRAISDQHPVVDVVSERVLTRLLAGSPAFVTYEQIESAMQSDGLDPFMEQTRYQWLLNQLDLQGIVVRDDVEMLDQPDDWALVEEGREILESIRDAFEEDEEKAFLTAAEERRLFELIADGKRARKMLADSDNWEERDALEARLHTAEMAKEELCAKNIRLVHHLVNRHGKFLRTLEYEDLLQEGSIGMMTAIDKFDLNLKTRFTTYAVWWIRQAITRARADLDRTIRLPVHLVEEINRLKVAEAELRQYNNGELSLTRLAWNLGYVAEEDLPDDEEDWSHDMPPSQMTPQLRKAVLRIKTLLHRADSHPVSLETPIGSDEGGSTLGDLLPDDSRHDPYEEVLQRVSAPSVQKVLEALNERERFVLARRFGFVGSERQTLEEIGRKLDVTRERVRQIEAKALRKLRHPLRKHLLKDLLG